MKTQILPNWCKKVGLILFIVTSFISGGDSFIDGFNSGYNSHRPNEEKLENKSHTIKPIEHSDTFKNYFGENLLHFFDVISIFGILMYMVSKEKIEDDYIEKLRLESYQLTAIIGLIVSIILYVFSENLKLTLDYFIILFIWLYLILFFIKKRMY